MTPANRPSGGVSRRGKTVVIGGTGTSIGKTHFSEALLRTWRRTARVVGLKPIETGVVDHTTSDAARLAAASTFHVKQGGYSLTAPLSPHLAARDEGIEIRTERIVQLVREASQLAEVVLVELAGGLFTPIADGVSNADLACALMPDALLLVAPDRLGVLHEVAATTRAAAASSLRIDGIVLSVPEHPDASTGRNAAELARVTSVPVVGVLPRAVPAALAELVALQAIVETIVRGRGEFVPFLGAGVTSS